MRKRLRRLARKSHVKLPDENRVILDTSFLLPYVGLKVKEISVEVMKWLENIDVYYPYAMIPELMGVVVKIARKKKLNTIPELALKGFNSIVYGDRVRLLTPVDHDLRIAYELVMKGLEDLFDAILYATSRRTGIKAVTLDEPLVEFLEKNGFKTDNIILLR